MSIYRVKDWNTHFENSKSREREQCSFVCVPNKQHGMGFSRVMAEKDGATIYGIWHLIIGALSQQKNGHGSERSGWLTLDGHQTGTPWTPDDLSLKFRRPEKEIERALEVLTSAKVGWLEVYESNSTECPPSARQLPAECPSGIVKEEKERIGEKEEKGKAQSISAVQEFCQEIELPNSDAEHLWHKFTGNGWTNGGKPIKDWKATVRSWKSAGYLPSQKPAGFAKPQQRVQPI